MAHLNLPIQQVMQACLATIEQIDVKRSKMREDAIQREMSKSRWFGYGRKWTHAQAEQWVDKDRGIASQLWLFMHEIQRRNAERILRLCEANKSLPVRTDMVMLSSDEFDMIEHKWPV